MATKRNTTTAPAIPQEGKCIRYDRETGDYACYLNGEFIGYASNYSDGETLCDRTYREQLEAGLYATATALDGGSNPDEMAAELADTLVTPEPVAIEIETWQNENGDSFTGFTAGAGLTKVMIGTYGSDKSGVELAVGGNPINERVEEVITLADLYQLRDNLTALLNDARVQSLAPEPPPTPAAPAFPIPTVPANTKSGSWQTQIGVIDGLPVMGHYAGRELMHAQLDFQGMPISVYGEYLSVSIGEGLGFNGDMYISEWRTLAALSRAGIVERLLALYERYQTAQGGWGCEGCGKTLTPEDEEQLCTACHEQRWQERFGHLRGAQAFRTSFQQVA